MRVLALLLPLLLTGCMRTTPFQVEIRNDGAAPVYLDASWGGVSLGLQGQLLDGWQQLDWSLDCERRCGQVQAEPCPAIAMVPQVQVLAAGDSVVLEKDGTAWQADRDLFGTCQDEIALEGRIRLEICPGATAEFWSAEADPTTTGIYEGELQDTACEAHGFELPAAGPLLIALEGDTR